MRLGFRTVKSPVVVAVSISREGCDVLAVVRVAPRATKFQKKRCGRACFPAISRKISRHLRENAHRTSTANRQVVQLQGERRRA
jgi:hypothetical protein